MSYKAPVKDMLFVLKNISELDKINQLSGFEDYDL